MKKFSRDNGDLEDSAGLVMSCSEAQDRIRQSIERVGRFILGCDREPEIGEIQQFAGLPFRVVRMVTHADAEMDSERLLDLWGPSKPYANEYYFEVEVAD